jgi:hypothetical protein
MIDIVKEIALKEIKEQSFELTKQFLSVNKLCYKEYVAFIEDVIFKEEDNTAEVYFPIEGESFYFVIYIDLLPSPGLRFMGMSAGNRVYLTVSSEEMNLDELSKGIQLIPKETWRKGEKIPNRNITRYYEDSGMIFELENKKTGEVEDKLINLLKWLEPLNSEIIVSSKEIYKLIQIVYYGYVDQMHGIQFKSDVINNIAKLNAHLDIDLYASGNELE